MADINNYNPISNDESQSVTSVVDDNSTFTEQSSTVINSRPSHARAPHHGHNRQSARGGQTSDSSQWKVVAIGGAAAVVLGTAAAAVAGVFSSETDESESVRKLANAVPDDSIKEVVTEEVVYDNDTQNDVAPQDDGVQPQSQTTPQHQAPQHQAPQYQAPQHQAPQHQAPQHQAPQHQAPQAHAPQQQAPHHHEPQHQAPQHQAPQHQAPQAQAPQVHVGGDVDIATGVDDSMSFSSAFAHARAEVGSGGIFVWHGKVYSTYTAEEWNSLTQAQKNEFAHNVTVHSGESKHYAQTHQAPEEPQPVAEAEAKPENETEKSEPAPADDAESDVAVVEAHVDSVETATTAVVDVSDDLDVIDFQESDVQILGVVHNNANNMNYAGLLQGDQQVILVDIDDDHVFNYASSDFDDDGRLDANEIAEISDYNISVDSLGGFTEGIDASLEPNIDDADVEYDNII